jgi:hypothetical protein
LNSLLRIVTPTESRNPVQASTAAHCHAKTCLKNMIKTTAQAGGIALPWHSTQHTIGTQSHSMRLLHLLYHQHCCRSSEPSLSSYSCTSPVSSSCFSQNTERRHDKGSTYILMTSIIHIYWMNNSSFPSLRGPLMLVMLQHVTTAGHAPAWPRRRFLLC